MIRYLIIVALFFLPDAAHPFQTPDVGFLDYTLEVQFDIGASSVAGTATIPVKKGQELRMHRGDLRLTHVSLNKERIDVSDRSETVRILCAREGTVEIGYEGIFKDRPSPGLPGNGVPDRVIDGRGIFLTGAWYPKPDQMARYHLRAAVPRGYEAVSEAERVERTASDHNTLFTFHFDHPLDEIHLVATDRYTIVEDRFNNVEILAYFFREDADLIRTYIEHTKGYLKLYGDLIGPFPYRRFSIVENFLPTGYSMPTYTLLGQEVLRLPFIPETSLGHETLHQWLGNLVYIDYAKGNWAEGLTTYLADHLYEEKKGQGAEYRKGALIDYQSYVHPDNEFPLRDFTARTDNASKAIGYGKAALVFHMLKKKVGEPAFYRSIRDFTAEMAFKKATWEDLRRVFERHYPGDLTRFFDQWIDRKGLPDLHLEEVEINPSGGRFEVAFTILQNQEVYELELPVTLYSFRGKTSRSIHLSKKKERFELGIDDLPEKIVLDGDYDLARTLSPPEFPPVIARVAGEEKAIIALPSYGAETYEEIIEAFKGKGRLMKADQIREEDLKTSSLVILGTDNPLIGRLYGKLNARAGFDVIVKENPWDPRRVAGIFSATSRKEVEVAFSKIFHYGKYSEISFDRGMNVSKKIEDSSLGITESLLKQPVAMPVSVLKTFPGVLEHVAARKILYIGEKHDQFSHHVMELEVIKDLHRRGRKMAIGMEMFQRPFQRALDDYIEGRIDEREFLRESQYFKRWGYDYLLYRPILQFARSEKIPVVALNLKQETVDRVFEGGLGSLSDEERRLLPEMDFSDDAYRERLKKVFQEHEASKTNSFDSFLEAQILWDETMSESIDHFLKTHPDHRMVVLAGDGHLAYGSGIPKRTRRRNGFDYAIVLNDVDVQPDISDYVLSPEPIPGPKSPKLMVLLKGDEGKAEIAGFPEGSVSEKAGMKAGDIIRSIGSTAVGSVEDVKIDLLFRKKGEVVRVVVLRKTLLEGDQEMNFEVALQ